MEYNINITNARKDLAKLVELVINSGLAVNITTKKGNAILIGEDHYRGLLETIYLRQNSNYKETLLEGLKEDVTTGTTEEEVKC